MTVDMESIAQGQIVLYSPLEVRDGSWLGGLSKRRETSCKEDRG